MTWPFAYQNASLEFERFMVDARDASDLATTNMAWNMVVGVLHAFRGRLTVQEVLRFADILPPVLRALFVEGWDSEAPILAFGQDEDLLAEVRSVRAAHNFAPPNAVQAVAQALRRNVDNAELDRVLATLPAGAAAFWSVAPSVRVA